MKSSLISVDFLKNNLMQKNIVVLDCTIKKVTEVNANHTRKYQIKNARFFDIKGVFSDEDSTLPNTVLSPEKFEIRAQQLGICKDSYVVCYDDLGIYSAPRVWWMFQLMGFDNVAVLDGGLPAWKTKNFPVQKPQKAVYFMGDFKVNYKASKLKSTQQVLNAISKSSFLIADARSSERFYAKVPEPRADLKRGHIPNSVNIPYTTVLNSGRLKPKNELVKIFENYKNKEVIIFTCGSGITASILALAAAVAGIKNYAIYDGSWTAWGSSNNLPIAT
ncbi:sulfurtransferase [Polaribacter tangerinus]|uniref:sulfurtransferase n=1 Tax=Polaribacter tangerinus TaxID=1920034 RepID=UPI000B4B3076|nr:sulfurtransferase [Polaribacter tangerinus]